MPRIIPEENNFEPSAGGPNDKVIQTSFIYQPGGSALGNVYNSFLALATDFNLITGPKIVIIDDSYVSPATIPSGIFDFEYSEFTGDAQDRNSPPKLQFEDGAIIRNINKISNLEIIGNSNSPVFEYASTGQLILENTIASVNTGMYPLIEASADFDLVLENTKFIGSEPILNVLSDTTTVWLYNLANILSDLITSSIGSDVNFNVAASNSSLSPQTGIDGSTVTLLLNTANLIDYNNGLSGLTATNVQDAIDELATTGGGSGVGGPGASTDFGIVIFDGTGGNLIQDSGVRFYGKSSSNPSSPSPADGDMYYNTVLKMLMVYDSSRSKWLSSHTETFHFGKSGLAQAGQYFKGFDGRVLSDSLGFLTRFAGTVVSISFTRGNTTSSTIEVTADGTTISSLGATISAKEFDNAINNDFTANKVLAVRNSSSSGDVKDLQGYICFRYRV